MPDRNVKALIEALKHHETIVNALAATDESTRVLFAGLVEGVERELAPREDGQMFTDEFIGEIIGIDLLREFRIWLPGGHSTDREVRASVSMGRGAHFDRNELTGTGVTMGFALAELRSKIRDHYGR